MSFLRRKTRKQNVVFCQRKIEISDLSEDKKIQRMKSNHPLFLHSILFYCSAQGNYPSATSKTIISRKPPITAKVPVLECSPKCASGISSSTTTYSMAPAAKDSSQGIAG